MCVVLPRLSWQGRRCALPLHPSGSGAEIGIEPVPPQWGAFGAPQTPSTRGVPDPFEPSRLQRGKGAFLLPLTHDREAFVLLWTPNDQPCADMDPHQGFCPCSRAKGVPALKHQSFGQSHVNLVKSESRGLAYSTGPHFHADWDHFMRYMAL